jgi:hypothetical protein
MLHGVLNMSPELWSDSPIDIAQRHARYVEASKRILELEEDAANQRRLADLALAHRDIIIKERDTLETALKEIKMYQYLIMPQCQKKLEENIAR